jgi:glutathione S-transferase
MRPWLVLAAFGIPFEEVVIPLDQPDTRRKMLRYAPSAKAPSLHDGDIHVHDSLAIIEYVAEKYPRKAIWPKTRAARAHARAISAEMHAGFQPLRQHCPTNFRREPRRRELTPEAAADVARIEAVWAHARKTFGKGGPFLFGKFSAADAMYAPVVNRLHIYDVKVAKATSAYMDAIMATPAWRAWIRDAAAEPWSIARYDAL